MDVRRVAAVLTVLALAGCTASPAPEPPPVVPPGPFTVDGAPLPDPSGLRLLFGGGFVDVDAGRFTPVPVTRWLPRPGQPPLLLDERPTGAEFGRSRVTAGPSSALPGAPTVVRLTGPGLAFVAASGDARAVWLAEYTDRTHCTLREVALDGRDRRPPRPVVCGTKPVAETPHGLWVDIGPDAFVEATVGSSADDHRMALLDPHTLAEKASFPQIEALDEDRVLVTGPDQWELRNLRTGQVTPLTRPPARGWVDPRVRPLDPSGRYLPLTFGEPGTSPQVMDLWVLDLSSTRFTRLPLMPAYTSLKGTDVGWDDDGRLVLVGRFPDKGLIATWRPGDAGYLVRPFDRPAAPAGAPVDTRFLVY